MVNLALPYNLIYFVFGYKKSFKGKDIILGVYDKESSYFLIDYSNSCLNSIKSKYENGELRLPFVSFSGVSLEYYGSLNRSCVKNESFFSDALSYSGIDDEEKGFIEVPNCGVIQIEIGVSSGLIWSTGRKVEFCDVKFEYEDFFGSDVLNIDIDPISGITLLRKLI